jgi:glycosyltransferase involved in cell wall biosynthesis
VYDHEVAMKVWYVLMIFPSPSETFVANDVRALSRLGIDVSVHALRGPRRDAAGLLRERGLADLEVTHATAGDIFAGLLLAVARPLRAARLAAWVIRRGGGRPVHIVKGLALLPRALALFRRLERDHPDVVHLYWGHYPAIFGWMVLQRAPRVVLSMSLSAYDLLRGFPGTTTVARKAHLVSTWAAANLPAIAAHGVPPAAVHVSWQGVDLDKVKSRSFDKQRHRVVTAGRLIGEKGVDDVIRAFARIAVDYPDATLVVLGDGPDRRRLERLAGTLGVAHAVTFRGHVAHDAVFEELARAEVFLFLSRYAAERLPNVVKEAMACRCFVVTTATPGIEEVLVDGAHGRVVPKGAWQLAAERTTEAFRDPRAAAIVAAAARNQVLQKFDVLRLMDGMVEKWKERATTGRNGPPRTPQPDISSFSLRRAKPEAL